MVNTKEIFKKDMATFKAVLENIKKPLSLSNGYSEYSALERKVEAMNIHPQDALVTLLMEDLQDETPAHSKKIQSYMLSKVMEQLVEQKDTEASPFVQLMHKKASGPLLEELKNFSGNHPEKLIRFKVADIESREERIENDRMSAHFADNNAQGRSEKQDCSRRQVTLDEMKIQVYHSMTSYNQSNAIRQQINKRPEPSGSQLSQ